MDFLEPFGKQNSDGSYGPTYEEWQAQLEAETAKKEVARNSALIKLANLGLTEEEARAVIGL
jgi:hypothetical protein